MFCQYRRAWVLWARQCCTKPVSVIERVKILAYLYYFFFILFFTLFTSILFKSKNDRQSLADAGLRPLKKISRFIGQVSPTNNNYYRTFLLVASEYPTNIYFEFQNGYTVYFISSCRSKNVKCTKTRVPWIKRSWDIGTSPHKLFIFWYIEMILCGWKNPVDVLFYFERLFAARLHCYLVFQDLCIDSWHTHLTLNDAVTLMSQRIPRSQRHILRQYPRCQVSNWLWAACLSALMHPSAPVRYGQMDVIRWIYAHTLCTIWGTGIQSGVPDSSIIQLHCETREKGIVFLDTLTYRSEKVRGKPSQESVRSSMDQHWIESRPKLSETSLPVKNIQLTHWLALLKRVYQDLHNCISFTSKYPTNK